MYGWYSHSVFCALPVGIRCQSNKTCQRISRNKKNKTEKKKLKIEKRRRYNLVKPILEFYAKTYCLSFNKIKII
jgi:hypothetical protein